MVCKKVVHATLIGLSASVAINSMSGQSAEAHTVQRHNAPKASTALHISHLDGMAPKLQITLPKSGSTKQFKGTLAFTNDTDHRVTLTLIRSIRISNSNAPRTLTLDKGARKKVSFNGSLSTADGYTAAGLIYSSSMGGQTTDLVSISVKNGQFKALKTGNFSTSDEGGKVSKPGRGTRIGIGIRNFKPARPGGKTFGKVNNQMGTKGGTKTSNATSSGLKTASASIKTQPWGQTVLESTHTFISQAFNGALSIFSPPASAANGTYRGRFIFRTINDSNISLPAPGVAIRAVAGTRSCLGGNYLASTTTDGNGNFQLNINTPGSYSICYILDSDLARIGRQNNSGLYVWKETLNSIPNGRLVRQPVRHDGALDIWYEAMTMQTSMQTAGINPVRSGAEKIKVKFPSDGTDPCANWSCADPNGNTWMFAGHAIRFGTMAHELAHQIDYKYRNFKTLREMGNGLPGAGGGHSYSNCYNPAGVRVDNDGDGFSDFAGGGIISEGWANFEMARALGSRNGSQFRRDFRGDVNGDIDSINMDANGTNCTGVTGSGINGSESVVSTVLWDFFDTRNDASDNLHYTNEYYLTNMYLARNPKTALELHSRIHSDCTSGSNSAVTNNGATCRAIFAQNGGTN